MLFKWTSIIPWPERTSFSKVRLPRYAKLLKKNYPMDTFTLKVDAVVEVTVKVPVKTVNAKTKVPAMTMADRVAAVAVDNASLIPARFKTVSVFPHRKFLSEIL